MAGRDHDATVEVVHAGDISHGRRSSDVQQIGICAGGCQACYQAVFEHIRAAAGVLTNNDTGRTGVAVALAQGVVVPTEEAAYLVGVVGSQINAGFTTEAISSKILSHYNFSSSKE